MLNMTEYASIYSVEYAKIILNVSDVVYNIKSLYNLLSSYRGRLFRALSNIEDGAYC